MFLVRDIFKAKAGASKLLVAKFKAASPFFMTPGVRNIRVLTDKAATFWTVVWEFEVDEIQDYFDMSSHIDSDSQLYETLEGYQDHVLEGHREIFKIES